jgi:hypothetical protein
MTSPPNKVLEFCLIKKTHRIFHRFGGCDLPRGLSITHDRRFLAGSRDVKGLMMLWQGVVQRWNTPFAPCCIMNLEKDNEFNNCDSSFNRAFVLQIDAREVFRDDIVVLDKLQSIVGKVLTQNSIVRGGDESSSLSLRKKYTAEVYTLDDIINPSDETFQDICVYQSADKQKVPYGESQHNDDKDAIMSEFQKWQHLVSRKYDVEVTGKLFVYPPNHHLGWHTNLETHVNYRTFRCYIVFLENERCEPESFFLYRHPISHLIHAVPDRHGYANIFYLGSRKRPLWHAVVNPSSVKRVSVGLAFRDNSSTFLHEHKVNGNLKFANQSKFDMRTL